MGGGALIRLPLCRETPASQTADIFSLQSVRGVPPPLFSPVPPTKAIAPGFGIMLWSVSERLTPLNIMLAKLGEGHSYPSVYHITNMYTGGFRGTLNRSSESFRVSSFPNRKVSSPELAESEEINSPEADLFCVYPDWEKLHPLWHLSASWATESLPQLMTCSLN